MNAPPAPSAATAWEVWSSAAEQTARPPAGQPLASAPQLVMRIADSEEEPVLESCHTTIAPPARSETETGCAWSPVSTHSAWPPNGQAARAGAGQTQPRTNAAARAARVRPGDTVPPRGIGGSSRAKGYRAPRGPRVRSRVAAVVARPFGIVAKGQ